MPRMAAILTIVISLSISCKTTNQPYEAAGLYSEANLWTDLHHQICLLPTEPLTTKDKKAVKNAAEAVTASFDPLPFKIDVFLCPPDSPPDTYVYLLLPFSKDELKVNDSALLPGFRFQSAKYENYDPNTGTSIALGRRIAQKAENIAVKSSMIADGWVEFKSFELADTHVNDEQAIHGMVTYMSPRTYWFVKLLQHEMGHFVGMLHEGRDAKEGHRLRNGHDRFLQYNQWDAKSIMSYANSAGYSAYQGFSDGDLQLIWQMYGPKAQGGTLCAKKTIEALNVANGQTLSLRGGSCYSAKYIPNGNILEHHHDQEESEQPNSNGPDFRVNFHLSQNGDSLGILRFNVRNVLYSAGSGGT